MKKYQFSTDEISLLVEAMAEYSHIIKPDDDSSDKRKLNYNMVRALYVQFKSDLMEL